MHFNSRQFGFQSGVSTSDTCLVLKEIMHDYSKNKQSGVLTYVDLSKAFDLVSHFKLGYKLLDKDIPIDIVYLLMHYLRNQNARLVWKDASSQYALIEKGVRQGGILSPFLFKLYIDCIIEEIASLDMGCIWT